MTGMLNHVVMFRFKKSASESAIADVVEGLRRLPGIIAEIKEFQVGRDLSHLARSYDLALIAGFENLESLGSYDAHPAHRAVVEKIKELSESIVSVDFEN